MKNKRMRAGDKYNRLTVVEIWKGRMGLFQCDCGNIITAYRCNVISGNTKSCGCYWYENVAKKQAHGQTGSPEHRSWTHMRNRCLNKKDKEKYPYYGGRGIKICDRWMKFENFFADMGKRPSLSHTLERIDNDGDYCPENCRWATKKEQANNRRPRGTALQ